MAKHPVPKKKTSKARTRRRFTSFVKATQKKLLNKVVLTKCKNCNATKMSHQVCKECGQYNGKQILDMKGKVDKAITKIKA